MPEISAQKDKGQFYQITQTMTPTELSCLVITIWFCCLSIFIPETTTLEMQIWRLEYDVKIINMAYRPGACVTNVNPLRPRQNGRHFANDIFKWIFANENVWIPIKISPKFVPQGPINNILALVQIMAWRRPGDKPLSEPMVISLLTHICVNRPQWVKGLLAKSF